MRGTDEGVEPRVGPWGVHRLEEGQETTVQVGPLSLHLVRAGDEIRLAHGHGERPGADGHREWARWATAAWDGRIALTPAFPDRPVVVEPEEPFHLLAGAEARIYVRVPLQVKVEALDERGSVTLAAVPSVTASDTWWGTLDEGELCYWIQTHARRAITPELVEDHLAFCPLQLQNRAATDLPVEKIALRVAFLSLYAHEGAIWSDETRVRYAGEAEGSRLDMAGRPPKEVPGATLLAPPAMRMARGFKARTFHRLRSLQGWM